MQVNSSSMKSSCRAFGSGTAGGAVGAVGREDHSLVNHCWGCQTTAGVVRELIPPMWSPLENSIAKPTKFDNILKSPYPSLAENREQRCDAAGIH